jgi:hypothetical protein
VISVKLLKLGSIVVFPGKGPSGLEIVIESPSGLEIEVENLS